ncbi:conserved hypothetical protein [Anaeromyxobacter dehalogenans 2CP-1]|uniref:Lipoprotein n=1 Tax=Anaeromyxobacter dehalogenans (strain ATCC BAA-258 / DSM 21875 / 2CP-1) TaxID=455488 RepID=B8JC47_ANAD2|nr:hypothetical protein [Anaeromyxobacter dehalogenans]ACL63969.1 conserved hypothetical protein [Anaeromyxobacter dehalogenans 2CP-1]
MRRPPLPRPAILVAAALLAGTSGCVAHMPRSDEPTMLLERSYVGASTASGQSFEAAPALHVLLHNGLDDPDVFERGGWASALSASFLATLRVSRGDSAPVRTPTYEPHAKLQLFHLDPAGARPAPSAPQPWMRMAVLELGGGHRSNGQRGCSLDEHVRRPGDGDWECAPATDPPSTALNLDDGSFTTNFVAGGAYLRLLRTGDQPGAFTSALTVGGGLEYEVACGLGACMPQGMRRRFGPVNARYLAEWEALVLRGRTRRVPLLGTVHLDSSLRATLSGNVHLGAARGPFGDLSAEVAILPRNPKGMVMGLFVRRHVGYDYLNIRFEERLDAWLFGLVLDPTPLDGARR